jgi:hypothetical protein
VGQNAGIEVLELHSAFDDLRGCEVGWCRNSENSKIAEM